MLSARQRMEEHRANPQCKSCHRVIDPLGLALENFDVTGMWRIRDNGSAGRSRRRSLRRHDADGPAGLRAALLKHKDVFLTFTENLMAYGLGRRVESFDMPAIRKIVRDAAQDNNRFSSFVLGIVKSRAFQMSARTMYDDERRPKAETSR